MIMLMTLQGGPRVARLPFMLTSPGLAVFRMLFLEMGQSTPFANDGLHPQEAKDAASFGPVVPDANLRSVFLPQVGGKLTSPPIANAAAGEGTVTSLPLLPPLGLLVALAYTHRAEITLVDYRAWSWTAP